MPERIVRHHPGDVHMGTEMGKLMYGVLKTYHAEGKRRVKQRAQKDSPKLKPREGTVTLKDAVFEVLLRAVEGVSGGHTLPYSARRLYYRVRKLIQEYTQAELTEGYFRDTLLQQYQREKGKLEGLYYEPRGELHEPHGGQTMKVGTREVEAYEFPPHLYNKLLYVEKRGQFPLLKSARLMERYDMAIMTGQGVATTAARTLMENAEKGQKMQIFVLHDADSYGYNISHTVREATERMPEHSVEVIDIGLTVEQGLELGIEPEDYTRPVALYERVLKNLDPESPAWEFFGADRATEQHVPCQRIELDALSAPEAIAHIEKKLGEEGVYGKVIPSAEELPQLVDEQYRALVAGWVDGAIYDLVSQGDVAKAIADELTGKFDLENARSHIEDGFKEDDALSWRATLKEKFTAIKGEHTDALKEAVREKIIEALEKE